MSGAVRYFIETWGCQMNELDSQRLAGQLMQQGLLPGLRADEADLILLNSCSVREKAAQKAYSRLGEYRLLKRRRPDLLIGFCGCVAQEEGRSALRRIPELDFVLGPGRVGEISHILRQIRQGSRVVATGFPETRSYDIDAVDRDGLYKGMVTVIEGCNKRCTFCIVPLTRGPETSRPLSAILEEVRHLLDYGFVEIELLGQTVNHWRGTGERGQSLDFADLLEAVASMPGLERLRFVTSYPRDFSPRMVEQVGRHPNICPYLHLPVQSGSDRMLRAMGRAYTAGEYRRLAADLRAARSDLALSTDIIVGFPGETEEDFGATLDLIRELRFSCVYAFKYSPRPGTAAVRLTGGVSSEIADRRLQDVFRLQEGIQLELNRRFVGEVVSVLVTGHGREPGNLTGRTACHRSVHFRAAATAPSLGSLVDVRIDEAYAHSLIGVSPSSGMQHVAASGLPILDSPRKPAGESRPTVPPITS